MPVAASWGDFFVAVLSVNHYPVERVYGLLAELGDVGVLDARNLSEWDVGEISRRLKQAGYDRGTYLTDLMADRLSALGRYFVERDIAKCEETLESGDEEHILRLIMPAKGIGPTVCRNFLMLKKARE